MTKTVSTVRRIVTIATLLVTSVFGTGGGAPQARARNDPVLHKAHELSSYGILPLKVAIQKLSGKSIAGVATNRDLENVRRHLIEPTLEKDPLAIKGKYDVLVVFGTRKDYLDALAGIVHVSRTEHSMRDKGIFCLNKNMGAAWMELP